MKFFRKFRMDMIDQGRLRRYTLYAIGEIVVVVIGILIAVQLNNWNQERILERENTKILKKLVNEIELNKNRMYFLDTGFIWNYSKVILRCEKALASFEVGLDTATAIWSIEEDWWLYSNFNLHSSIYSEMVNTGNLYRLRSNKLVTAIQSYYQRLEREEAYNLANGSQMRTIINATGTGYHMLINDYAAHKRVDWDQHAWLLDPSSDQFIGMKYAALISLLRMQDSQKRVRDIVRISDELLRIIIEETNLELEELGEINRNISYRQDNR